MITDEFQRLNDIDWFCIINGVPVHVASAGDLLPTIYSSDKSVAFLKSILSNVLKLPLDYDYKLNDEYLDAHVLNEGYEYLDEQENPIGQDMDDDWNRIMTKNEPLSKRLYATSFVEMARRGFYSFDKTEDKEGVYHLVAYPSKGMKDWKNKNALSVKGVGLDFTNPKTLVNVRLVELINEQCQMAEINEKKYSGLETLATENFEFSIQYHFSGKDSRKSY